MQQETEDNTTSESTNEAKPTITIAEKQGSSADDGETSAEAKPTITIAEKDGGE